MRSASHSARDAALLTIQRLRARGHVALLAGGCVRDMLLGRTPKDFDVATDATPARVKAIFARARQVGAKFGVMLIRQWGHEIEVATFRADGPYIKPGSTWLEIVGMGSEVSQTGSGSWKVRFRP